MLNLQEILPTAMGVTYRNEEIWDHLFILFPRITILSTAALDVSDTTVKNHDGEESRIEPREWRFETSNGSPCKSEEHIGGIMRFTSQTIWKDNTTSADSTSPRRG